jgi:signal peptidase I
LSEGDGCPAIKLTIEMVPAGKYFMPGDNRDHSADSRFSMGSVPYGNPVGKAVRLFWNSNGVDYSSRQVVNATR